VFSLRVERFPYKKFRAVAHLFFYTYVVKSVDKYGGGLTIFASAADVAVTIKLGLQHA
jgi:hypothetical protein